MSAGERQLKAPATWKKAEHLRAAQLLNIRAGALASNGQLGNLRRMLQQQESSSGAVAGDNSGADVPGCRTPWETFNSTAELSFWAEALQTVGFAGTPACPAARQPSCFLQPCCL